jgi:hypothetical protein
MGVDTRFWGPSAWQLFHYVSFHAKDPASFLRTIKDILPCRFCRKSSAKFMRELPMEADLGHWVWALHNRVNLKLRTQCQGDPAVVDPGQDPSFDEVKTKYVSMNVATGVLGRDFLLSVASNYKPTPHRRAIQETLVRHLVEVYPVPLGDFVRDHPPALDSTDAYKRWMYSLLSHAGSMPSYNGLAQRLAYYTSGCDKASYKGKTCRRVGGVRTKARDHRKTRRITHVVLL